MNGAVVEIGLYGKLPSHGDFLKRRMPPEFEQPWDDWLQAGIAASRAALEENWSETYLTSPVWRFAFAAGACGRAPVAGLLAPSVDRVGRYFPLTLVWRLPQDLSPLGFALLPGDFLASAEQLLVDGLTAEAIDFEHFDAEVEGLADGLAALLGTRPAPLATEDLDRLILGQHPGWQLPSGSLAPSPASLGALLARLLESGYAPQSLWWTEGSAAVEPCWLLSRGLPPADGFVALLNGAFQGGAWQGVRALGVPPRPAPFAPAAPKAPLAPATDGAPESSLIPDTPAAPMPPLTGYASAALTDPGSVRTVNQDAFLERADVGVWVVADGLGGLKDGEVASRMVCDALAGFVPDAALDATVETMRRRIEEVNTTLYQASQRLLDPVQSGSTVVALAVRDGAGAILWAGDSRAYRMRGQRLEALTTDHGAEPDAATTPDQPPPSEFAISRAVGGEESLELDVRREAVQSGDRILLCSDGLTRALEEGAIAKVLADATLAPFDCARRLVDAALAATAKDNVTVIVVDAR